VRRVFTDVFRTSTEKVTVFKEKLGGRSENTKYRVFWAREKTAFSLYNKEKS